MGNNQINNNINFPDFNLSNLDLITTGRRGSINSDVDLDDVIDGMDLRYGLSTPHGTSIDLPPKIDSLFDHNSFDFPLNNQAGQESSLFVNPNTINLGFQQQQQEQHTKYQDNKKEGNNNSTKTKKSKTNTNYNDNHKNYHNSNNKYEQIYNHDLLLESPPTSRESSPQRI